MTTKTVTITDPFADVRKAMLETVEAMTENHDKAAKLAQAEFAKAKASATEQVGKAQATLQANIDAAVAAGEIVAAGAEKAGSMVMDEVAALTESRVAAVKKVIGATSVADAFDAQTAMFKAEQEKFAAFAKTFAELAQTVANDAFKPVKVQAEENMKALKIKAA
ncbi:MAG: phasin family protein [Rhodospirillaceae bacterium]